EVAFLDLRAELSFETTVEGANGRHIQFFLFYGKDQEVGLDDIRVGISESRFQGLLELVFLPDQCHEFLPCLLSSAESTKQRAGEDHGVLLFNPTHSHAQVLCFDDDGHAKRIELLHDGICDLVRKPFLNLKSSCVDVYQTGEFGNTNDLVMRDIGDVGFTEEGQQVMFAKGIKINIPLNDHLFVVFGEKGVIDDLCRILLIALGQERQSLSHAVRCLCEPLTIRI